MKISPLDIRNKDFPSKRNGLDRDTVYEFLSQVREEMEELLRENARIREENSKKEKELLKVKAIEADIKKTVIGTKRIVEEYKRNVIKEVAVMKKEAEIHRNCIIREAQNKAIRIHEDIVDLLGAKRHFQDEIRRLVQGHLEMLHQQESGTQPRNRSENLPRN